MLSGDCFVSDLNDTTLTNLELIWKRANLIRETLPKMLLFPISFGLRCGICKDVTITIYKSGIKCIGDKKRWMYLCVLGLMFWRDFSFAANTFEGIRMAF